VSKIVIAGLLNVETSTRISEFPIEYAPIEFNFWGVNTSISGVGFNILKALNTLKDQVSIVSLVGDDLMGNLISDEISKLGIDTIHIFKQLKETPLSTILFDSEGKRRIYCDLKDIQDCSVEAVSVTKIIENADIVVPTCINFARPILREAKRLNKIIAIDVQVLSDIYDEYQKEFLENADIVFLSNECVKEDYYEFIYKLADVYPIKIIVMGMGANGCLLYVRETDTIENLPAVNLRKVVNTIGAGDALFSAFLHFYSIDSNPYEALRKATYFAAYKIGESGGAEGFIDEKELLDLMNRS